jgi:UDP-N-acetylmuramyl pentapeptide phosphotransferase/UDP-N-acetylglucosamine-1-phosphate transferase
MAGALILVSAFVLALALSHAIARYASRNGLAPDHPNGRSSHARPTSRAGGFAIFAGFAVGFALVTAFNAGSGGLLLYAPLAAGAVAAFSFGAVDDMRPLGARAKLAAQILIAIGFVAFAGPVESIPFPFVGDVDLGMAAYPLTAFWIVAFMNAFNFMDGVNGIAGACAIFVLSAISVAAAGPWAAPAALLACALFGFLPLNLPHGKVFMGDGGSQFIGFMIAALAVLAARSGEVSPAFAPLAFLPFLFDVAFTLAHRVSRGKNIFEAHNEHVYQLLVRLGRSHQGVTMIYLTLIAVSTTAAVLTNASAPGLQLAVAAGLCVIFLAQALGVYRRAAAAGLISQKDEAPLPAAEPQKVFRAAAE